MAVATQLHVQPMFAIAGGRKTADASPDLESPAPPGRIYACGKVWMRHRCGKKCISAKLSPRPYSLGGSGGHHKTALRPAIPFACPRAALLFTTQCRQPTPRCDDVRRRSPRGGTPPDSARRSIS